MNPDNVFAIITRAGKPDSSQMRLPYSITLSDRCSLTKKINLYCFIVISSSFATFIIMNMHLDNNYNASVIKNSDLEISQATTLFVPTKTSKNIEMKYILLWTNPNNFPFIYFGEGNSVFVNKKCKSFNCYVTGDKSLLGDYTEFEVIAFNGPQLDFSLYDIPERRLYKQKYVYANIESAANYPICTRDYNHYFNWTWTYKLSSDAVWGYIVIRDANGTVIGPSENMHWINVNDMEPIDTDLKLKLKSKRNAAAWFASNCVTKSRRESFVGVIKRYLKEYSLNVDIYGDCGKLQCPKEIMSRCLQRVQREYYFYFAFENALSEDYVTEKILYALNYNTVPVVFGGANYSKFMPEGIYLNALQLGPKKLAKKMFEIIQNETEYYNFFRWKKYYSFHFRNESPETDDYCKFCAMINDDHLFNYSTVYKEINLWWTDKGFCSYDDQQSEEQSRPLKLNI